METVTQTEVNALQQVHQALQDPFTALAFINQLTPKGPPKESPVKSLRSPPVSSSSLRAVHNTTSGSKPPSPDDAVCLHRSTAVCPSTSNLGNNAVQLFQHSQHISKRYCSVLYADKDMQLPPFLRSSYISWLSSNYKRIWRISCQICYFTTFPLTKCIL